MTGSLELIARRSGRRTVLERLRYDGISRCSRAFAHSDAALVVFSQLGPGVIRGDRVTCRGHVRPDAHLIVTAQSATRLMGGVRPAFSQAAWTLEAGALLELVGEPLVALPDTDYRAETSIDLAPGARILLSELACVPATAAVRLTTSVRVDGREVVYDAVDAGAAAPHSVGTFVAAGFGAHETAALTDALDAAAETCADATIGVGTQHSGVFARIVGTDLWTVRSALAALRSAAQQAVGV